MTRSRFVALVPLALAFALGAAAAARAAEPDWDKVAQVRDIEIITHDKDGDVRETTIWLAVLDGQGFIRTGNSNWAENIQRNPFAGLGKPEPLKRNLSGWWSRRITREHRLVYRVKGGELQIAQCRFHY